MNFKLRSAIIFLLSTSFSFTCFSQINQWTWMQGDSTSNNIAVNQSPGTTSPANTPGGRRFMASWTDNTGNLYLYGGICSGPSFGSFYYLNDLWKYDPSLNEWKTLVPTGQAPQFKAGSAYWTDRDKNFWLFGGSGNDMWKYAVSTNTWTKLSGSNNATNGHYGSLNTPSASNIPGGRAFPYFWADKVGNFWIYGGTGFGATGAQQSFLSDLWKYNVSTGIWTWVAGDSTINHAGDFGIINVPAASNNPGGRYEGSSWVDDDNNLWLFGGAKSDGGTLGGTYIMNDVWKYDILLNQWIWKKGSLPGPASLPHYNSPGIFDPANTPGSTLGSTTCKDADGNFWLFGGVGLDPVAQAFGNLNTLWKYDPGTNEWAFIKGDAIFWGTATYGIKGIADAANKPGARAFTASWTDNAGNLWFYGGGGLPPGATTTALTFQHNDLWKFTLVDPLPVKLIAFTGKLQNETVLLNWTTENEINVDRYEIERSFNGINFEKIARVNAQNLDKYNVNDIVSEFKGKIIYYRLRMVDADGKFSYSNMIKFHIPVNVQFTLYPNPANNYTSIRFNKNISGHLFAKITDITGKTVMQNDLLAEDGETILSTKNLTAGTYTVTVVYDNNRFTATLVIAR